MELVIGVLVVVAGLLGCGVVSISNSRNRSQLMTTKRYRETTTSDRYTIEYRKQSNGTYKIFCTEHPYNSQSTSVHKCHLYSSGEVCVAAGREPRTLDRAKAIAMIWLQGYSQYVRTGKFSEGKRRVNV